MIPNVKKCGLICGSTGKKEGTNIEVYGCDTETYRDSEYRGLKSIQIYGSENYYFSTDNWDNSDENIRYEICKKFFDWLLNRPCDVNIAFFNMNFDASQFLKYMVSELGLEFWNSALFIPKGCIQILESERQLYLIQIRTFNGFLIRMIDIANFLVGVTLNEACESWLGKKKIDLPTKKFDKSPATEIEKRYAMMDAQLTYELFNVLTRFQVIEGHKTVTIAGRTIRHFKDFIKERFRITFNEYFYEGASQEEIKEIQNEFEYFLRPGVRGGVTESYQKGVFKNCIHYDARSMYPTQCVRDFIPLGKLLDEPPNEKFTRILWPVGFFSIKKGCVPCMQWRTKVQCNQFFYKSKYEPGDYVNDFFLDGSYPIWEEEYEIIKRVYDIENEEIYQVKYIKMVPNVVLKPYVEMLYKGKNENTGSKKLYYKYLLNALYGKFLSRPDGVGIDYIFDGQWKRVKVPTEKQVYYLPLGSWIAMMGRVTLFNAILSVPAENFLYCDTDSMILEKGCEPDIKIGKNLGDWSVENDDFDVNIVGPKTYQELNKNGKLLTKCGGLPRDDKARLKWLELKEGLVVHTAKPKRDKETWAINFQEVDYTISTKATIFRSR